MPPCTAALPWLLRSSLQRSGQGREIIAPTRLGGVPKGLTADSFRDIVADATRDPERQLWLAQRFSPLSTCDPSAWQYAGHNLADAISLDFTHTTRLAELVGAAFARKAVEWKAELYRGGV